MALPLLSFSQDLVITYGVSTEGLLDEEQKQNLSEEVQKIFLKAQNNFKNISYTLRIKEDESLFFRNETLMNDGKRNMKTAMAMAGFSGKFYINTAKNIRLHRLDVYGKEFLIESDLDNLSWEITRETKIIKNIKVFKAISEETYNTGKEIKQWNIVAWFAPEINKPIGPGGYGGLPGLILEMKRGNKKYFIEDMKTLELTKKELSIPDGGESIKRKEFDAIGEEMVNKIDDYN